MSFASIDYELTQGITTLVFGENKDNDSQKSNGSGKSALLECISVGITGSPMRKVKNEEIINDTAEDCEVCLEFINPQLKERMVIERQFFRKGSSTCNVDLYRNGELVVTDEAKQSSVDEYNKYILAQLGITRDELYNNFLLSKHKYQDFLSSSDKEKKDIINRFSNGNKVDEAIEKVKEDMAPIEEEHRQSSLKISNTEGKIEVVTEQIQAEKDRLFDKQSSLQDMVKSLEDKIAGRRSDIRGYNESLDVNYEEYESLLVLEKELDAIENEGLPINEAYVKVQALFEKYGAKGLSDWEAKSESLLDGINKLDQRHESLIKELEEAEEKKTAIEAKLSEVSVQKEEFYKKFPSRKEAVEQKITSTQTDLEAIDNTIADLSKKKRTIASSVANLKAKLSGAITCPKCSHQFVLAEEGFDVSKAREEVDAMQKQSADLDKQIADGDAKAERIEQGKAKLMSDKQQLSQEKATVDQNVADIQSKLRLVETKVTSINNDISGTITQLKSSSENVCKLTGDMFSEAFDILDKMFVANDKAKEQLEDNIADAEGRIEAFKANIEEIKKDATTDTTKSLEETLKKLREDLEQQESERRGIEKRLKDLNTQIERFNEFKTYLANTKIEALSTITNEFLEHIGSDIRIKFSGYTMLKSGKIRDKISISLLRNGLDCGSYGKFSEGEKARANLASILAMQKLVNSNCELDRGLDLIVLDEILESVDEDGLASMFKVLNKLEVTALVVSHGLVSENYPYKLIVTKENGESVLRHAN